MKDPRSCASHGVYDEASDVYICPAGHQLKPKRVHKRREMTDYVADRKACAQCPLRADCTRSKTGRSVARHWKETELEIALAFARLPEAQADRRRRRYLMEGSFAQAANKHHFKRARWRRLWRQQIQDWLIAAVQNIALICGATHSAVGAKRSTSPKNGAAAAVIARLRVMDGLRVTFRAPRPTALNGELHAAA